MAKLQLFDGMGVRTELTDFYNEGELFLVDEGQSETAVDFIHPDLFPEITFKGTGFTYNEDDIATGTLKAIEFYGNGGAPLLAKLTGLDVDAAETEDTLYMSISTMLGNLLRGDDKIFGSDLGDMLVFGVNKGDDLIDGGKGRDIIGGGKGKDTLTGGAQGDYFLLTPGSGKEVVTDFDAVGGGNKQDYIYALYDNKEQIDIIKDGKNTIIEFEGASMTLLDVARKDVSMADFAPF
jgi:Ca2+-binding RTX toxin-like protein